MKHRRWMIAPAVVVAVGVIVAGVLLLPRSTPSVSIPGDPGGERVGEDAPNRATPAGDPGIPIGTAVGQRAPGFTLPDLEGASVSLSDFDGEVVLLDFWASWCAPCRVSMPSLERFRERYAARGMILVGVSLDYSEDDAIGYIESKGYAEMVALYGSFSQAHRVSQLYGAIGIPRTFLIDRQGVIRYAGHPARLTADLIESWL